MNKIFVNFWKNKRVFLTGHSGFKGSWMSFLLTYFGAKVTGYSLKQTNKKSFYHALSLKNLLSKEYINDICNFSKLKNAYENCQPDIVFHFASNAIVIDSYSNPRQTIDTNIVGLQNLLEIIRLSKKKPKSIIIITSDKCYKNISNSKIFNENDKLGGDDPYSASKAMQEILAEAYNKSYFKKKLIATARGGNVIGGGDRSDYRIVPDIINCFEEKKILRIRNKDFIRPWQFILDCLFGYEKLARFLFLSNKRKRRNNFSGGWNFGPKSTKNYSVLDLLKISKKYFPNKIIYKKKKYSEKPFLRLFIKKTNNLLNYNPKFNFYDSVNKTFDWYASQSEKRDMRLKTISQIEDYIIS